MLVKFDRFNMEDDFNCEAVLMQLAKHGWANLSIAALDKVDGTDHECNSTQPTVCA